MNKHYAVSDLHGMYTLWRNVLKELDDTDTLYILGDCADRGPRGWDIIKEALADPRVIYIRGNHDQMLLDACLHPWDYEATNLWYWNGGGTTHDAIISDPKTEIYIKELNKTKYYSCYKNTAGQRIHLTHAGYNPTKENENIPWHEDLLWDRGHITEYSFDNIPNDYVVFGHTFCGSSFYKNIDIKLNDTKTVGRYCGGHQICIDGRSFIYNRCALLDLDPLEEKVIKSDATDEILY